MKLATTVALLGSVLATAALAQTPTAPPQSSTAPTPNSTTGTPPGTGVVDRNTGAPAASGDRNQAVTTTDANAGQPAHGRNSFTAREARRRIECNGYNDVTGLTKDVEGVWHGTATKGGNKIRVWLDYKGNVGASS